MAAMVQPALGLAVRPPSLHIVRQAPITALPAAAPLMNALKTIPIAARRAGIQFSASSSRAAALPRYFSSPSR